MQYPVINRVADGVWIDLVQSQFKEKRLYFVGVFNGLEPDLFLCVLMALRAVVLNGSRLVFISMLILLSHNGRRL